MGLKGNNTEMHSSYSGRVQHFWRVKLSQVALQQKSE